MLQATFCFGEKDSTKKNHSSNCQKPRHVPNVQVIPTNILNKEKGYSKKPIKKVENIYYL